MPTERRLLRACALPLSLCVLVACEEPDPPPFAPEFDAGTERPDGSLVFRVDGGRDGAVEPADAASEEDADVADASGPLLPNVDGVIDESEWAGALEVLNDTAPVALTDRLSRLLVRRTEGRLYVAIEGSVAEGRGMLMLVDADYGGDPGVVLNGSALSDYAGSLDTALSSSVFSTADPELRPDYAWGALGIPLEIDGADESAGWREIATRSDDFLLLTSGNRTACTVDACETSIAIGAPGIEGAGEIALAVRSGSEAGYLSNQTLPTDLSSSPESISVLLRVPAPATPAP